jgi:hypothetical protein
MTEYELVDNAMTYFNAARTAFGMYITVVSGYVIAAFVAGKRLNRAQVWIVNLLFFCTASLFTLGTVACYARTNEYANRLLELDPNRTSYFTESAAIGVGVLQILGIAACLYFMWSVRHPKTE